MRIATLAWILGISAALAPAGDDWPQWRGPTLDGVSPCRNLPTEWSETRNIIWKVPLPAWSAATPIVTGDYVFVTSPSKPDNQPANVSRSLGGRVGRGHPGGSEILLLCFSKSDGRQLWTRTIGDSNTLYGKQNMASPSPVSDGKHVWTLTGSGILTALDLDGNPKWRHDLQGEYGKFGLLWGYASSPLLYQNLIIVQVLHGTNTSAPSYLVAFDGTTGKVIWRRERKTDAQNECPDAYTTPTISTVADRTDLIVSGADYVTGHDPLTGSEIWRAAGLNPEPRANYRVCGSPVTVGNLIIAPSRVRPMIALRGGGNGDVTDSHLVWTLTKGGPDVPTPVSDGTLLYVVNDQGLVTCLNVSSGETIWGPVRTARGTVSASPLLGDGKLYITNESAITTVLAAGPEFKLLATNELDDSYTLSSIATSDSRLFLRTSSHLYCIGMPDR